MKQHDSNLFLENISFFSGWLLHLVNAFLIYAIVTLLVFPLEKSFIQLNAHLPFLAGLSLVVLGAVGFYFLGQRFQNLKSANLLTIFLSAYLFLVIWKSPSILISLGFFLLTFALYAKLSWEKNRYRYFIPLSLLLTFPKLAYQLFHPATMDLGRFVINPNDWISNRIWMILASLAYAICLYLLLDTLPERLVKNLVHHQKLPKYLSIFIALFGLSFVIYLAIISAYKVTTFSVSTFDIGIFSQMFESMRRDLTQVTSLERDKFLSHFGVHISPIYYLLLPIYALFPYGETLEAMQVVIVFSGVLPLYLILKKMHFPALVKPLILLWFFLTPSLTTAGSYHLHENCFLVPLLLWLIYANMSQWRWRLALVTLLTLMIKEDAFIYVISIGLYFLLQKRFNQTKQGKLRVVICLLLFPLLYFALCLSILNQYGEGAMVSRFDNFLLNGQVGLGKVLENIFLNPTYTLASFFSQTKLRYIFILLLTQAFLPILQKEWANYLLFIPLLVINLLSDWVYQVDFGFQYSYGSPILLFFLSILALEAIYIHFWQEKNLVLASKRALSMVGIACLFSAGILYSSIHNWHQDTVSYFRDRQHFDDIHYVLSTIPRDKAVLSYYTYTVDLRDIPQLYDIFYHQEQNFDEKIDLLVFPRSVFEKASSKEADIISLYLQHGYQESAQSTKTVQILEKPSP